MKVFLLDDEAYIRPRSEIIDILAPNHELTVATSFYHARDIYKPPYDLLLLDHDMRGLYGEDPRFHNTGWQFVVWMREMLKPAHVILHSHYEKGRYAMGVVLEDHKIPFEHCPFSPSYLKLLKERYS